MKRCPQCVKTYDDAAILCPYDGSPLLAITTTFDPYTETQDMLTSPLNDNLEQSKGEYKSAGVDKDTARFIFEFEEIKTNILETEFGSIFAHQLKMLETFLHTNSFLLNRSDVRSFYEIWIRHLKLESLEYGASLDLREEQYARMKAQLAQINLQSVPQNKT